MHAIVYQHWNWLVSLVSNTELQVEYKVQDDNHVFRYLWEVVSEKQVVSEGLRSKTMF